MALTVIYALAVVGSILAVLLLSSFTAVGPTEVGLITKRFSFKKLPEDNPVAFKRFPPVPFFSSSARRSRHEIR
jgi:hypothetical protein